MTFENRSDKEQIIFLDEVVPVVESDKRGSFFLKIPSLLVGQKPVHIKPKTDITKNIVFQINDFVGIARISLEYLFIGELGFITSAQQELCFGPLFSNTITIDVKEKKK